ncbi:DUF5686 family protein [Flavobacteriaceae bacterium]|nr:DUF5686 family protein [Flavobacteriaceae bacterium]
MKRDRAINKCNPLLFRDKATIDLVDKTWKKFGYENAKEPKPHEYDYHISLKHNLQGLDSVYTVNPKNANGFKFLEGLSNGEIYSREELIHTNKNNGKFTTILGRTPVGRELAQGLKTYEENLNLEYHLLDDFIKLFGKVFSNPVGKGGLKAYDYVLNDSLKVDNDIYYHVLVVPKTVSGLIFNGDFWISKKDKSLVRSRIINRMDTNIIWVNYVTIKKDFILSKDGTAVLPLDESVKINYRLDKLNDDPQIVSEKKIKYKYFKQKDIQREKVIKAIKAYEIPDDEIFEYVNSLHCESILDEFYAFILKFKSNYIPLKNIDIGAVTKSFNYNSVEGLKIRVGARTFYDLNDRWRAEGYLGYGFKNQKPTYGFSYKHQLHKTNRFMVGVERWDDIARLGTGINADDEDFARRFMVGELVTSRLESSLARITSTRLYTSFNPSDNLKLQLNLNRWTSKSATEGGYNMSYLDANGNVQDEANQFQVGASFKYTPGRVNYGNGVERMVSNSRYPVWFLSYAKGYEETTSNGSDYKKVHFYYRQPLSLGGAGVFTSALEVAKTFGTAPVAFLNIAPGNESLLNVQNNLGAVNYNEFVTDQYASLHLEYNFKGVLFDKIPLLNKTRWQEIIGVRGVYGSISDANIQKNTPFFSQPMYASLDKKDIAPTKGYYEYNLAFDRVFKIVRLDMFWRGSYLNKLDIDKFAWKVSFGFVF